MSSCGKKFNDGDFNARQLQGFAGFDADQAAADDDGFFDFAFIADLAQKIRVFHGLQRSDALQVRAGNGRHARDGTGGDNQFVIVQAAGFTRCPYF